MVAVAPTFNPSNQEERGLTSEVTASLVLVLGSLISACWLGRTEICPCLHSLKHSAHGSGTFRLSEAQAGFAQLYERCALCLREQHPGVQALWFVLYDNRPLARE